MGSAPLSDERTLRHWFSGHGCVFEREWYSREIALHWPITDRHARNRVNCRRANGCNPRDRDEWIRLFRK